MRDVGREFMLRNRLMLLDPSESTGKGDFIIRTKPIRKTTVGHELTIRWHRWCLKCATCKTTVDASKVSDKDGSIYCKNCYAKVSQPFIHLS